MTAPVEFRLPDIGEGLHEAEVVTWLVAVGDRVERNQPFVEIMTDKSSVEMPAPVAGVVSRLGATEGEIIQVGDLLIVIDGPADDGAPSPAAPAADGHTPPPAAAAGPPDDAAGGHTAPPPAPGGPPDHAAGAPVSVPSGAVPSGSATAGRRPKASPSTRKLAAELGIDLASVSGTGPGGRILADDVRTVAAAPPTTADGTTPGGLAAHAAQRVPSADPAVTTGPDPAVPSGPGPAVPPGDAAPGRRPIPATAQMAPGIHPLRGVRRATAKAMDRSWSTIPHINAMNEVDAGPLLALRAELRRHQGPEAPNITPLVIVLMAVARALRLHPVMNATLDLEAETITVHQRINLGVAVATERGLLVPVIADADQRSVSAMAAELQRLTLAARSASTTAADLQGGTYTVSNFGAQGTYTANPLIRPGETGITGLGVIAERPMVVDGAVVARPTMPVVVAGDHRLVDGDVLSSFHNDICSSLAAPIGLLL
ncbi:MAG: dihydrolipoamide acetyltransferase family protein [Actinomycetota bacterium]